MAHPDWHEASTLGFWIENFFTRGFDVLFAGVVGFLGYGVSLALFVVALRHLGAARAAAFFQPRRVLVRS